MASLRLREKATEDLVSIGVESRERWGDAAMRRYVGAIDHALQTLAQMPHLGRACEDLREGYRQLAVGSHVIFDKLTEAQDVDVSRILHGRMQPRGRLAESDE